MRLLATAALSSILLTVAGCGGGGSSKSGAPSPAPTSAAAGIEGTYAGETVVETSTVKGESVGPSTREASDYFFTCADETCSRVYQRTNSPAPRLHSLTFLFSVTGTTWSAVHLTDGTCTDAAQGTYTQRIEWTWRRAADGTFEGGIDKTFKGCKSDGTAHLTASIGRRTSPTGPYLSSTDATAMKALVTGYDNAMKPIYADYPKCEQQLYKGDANAGAACFKRLLGSWVSVLGALQSAVAALPPGAPKGTCKAAVDSMSSAREFAAAFTAAIAAFNTGAAKRDYQPAVAKLDEAGRVNERFQPFFVSLATQCVAPNDLHGLGTEGKLETDVQGLVLGQSH